MSTPYERWQLGMSLITVRLGPEEDRGPAMAAALTGSNADDLIAGTLDIAIKLLHLLSEASAVPPEEILRILAQRAADQHG
jgi:hypothetical protein